MRYDSLARESFEINPRDFIAMIWPEAFYADRMKKVVIANSFFMQAHGSGGRIPANAAKEYGVYLKCFVSAFPNAVVVAAGVKAQKRCEWAAIKACGMGALTPPGSNNRRVRASWRTVADHLRREID